MLSLPHDITIFPFIEKKNFFLSISCVDSIVVWDGHYLEYHLGCKEVVINEVSLAYQQNKISRNRAYKLTVRI